MQNPQRNIAKFARRRVLVVITARTRGSGKEVVQCYAVSRASCLLGAGLQISGPFLVGHPLGGAAPTHGSAPPSGVRVGGGPLHLQQRTPHQCFPFRVKFVVPVVVPAARVADKRSLFGWSPLVPSDFLVPTCTRRRPPRGARRHKM